MKLYMQFWCHEGLEKAYTTIGFIRSRSIEEAEVAFTDEDYPTVEIEVEVTEGVYHLFCALDEMDDHHESFKAISKTLFQQGVTLAKERMREAIGSHTV